MVSIAEQATMGGPDLMLGVNRSQASLGWPGVVVVSINGR